MHPPSARATRFGGGRDVRRAVVIPGKAWLMTGEPAAETVRWRSPGAGRQTCIVRVAVSGDLVAADAVTTSGLLEVADVICSDRSEPMSWLTASLDRFPGCAVAATPAAGGYLLATRACRPLILPCLLPNEPWRLARAGDSGSGAVACAMFVYAWLAAGWPLGALNPARLEMVTPCRVVDATPMSFCLYYEGPPATAGPPSAPSSASLRLISSASGAAIPE